MLDVARHYVTGQIGVISPDQQIISDPAAKKVLLKTFDACIGDSASLIVLNMDDITSITPEIVDMLIECLDYMKSHGGNLVICNCTKQAYSTIYRRDDKKRLVKCRSVDHACWTLIYPN